MALQSTTAIATITLQQNSSTVTFSGIPNNYRDLIVTIGGGVVSGGSNTYLRFNGDQGGNYNSIRMFGTGSATGTTLYQGETFLRVGDLWAGQNAVHIDLFDYSSTNKHKPYVSRSNGALNTVICHAGRWANIPDPISQITVLVDSGLISAGTVISLYGRIA